MDLEGFIAETNSATTVDQLFAVFESALNRAGFDRILFALLTDHPQLEEKEGFSHILCFPDDWMDHYLRSGYRAIDPVAVYGAKLTVPFDWGELQNKADLSKRQIQILNESREAGFNNGFAVPLRGAGGAIAGVSVASSDASVELDQLVRDKISLMSHQLYQCFWRLKDTSGKAKCKQLTLKETDVLRWSACGLTKREIATRMNVSIHTIDFHTRNILKKLQAANITAAVFKALANGELQM